MIYHGGWEQNEVTEWPLTFEREESKWWVKIRCRTWRKRVCYPLLKHTQVADPVGEALMML